MQYSNAIVTTSATKVCNLVQISFTWFKGEKNGFQNGILRIWKAIDFWDLLALQSILTLESASIKPHDILDLKTRHEILFFVQNRFHTKFFYIFGHGYADQVHICNSSFMIFGYK